MNIHHLELFYYVARHGGISEAVRKIPYGIQQPAVSHQIIQLEENLNVTLFQRRPFQLTPAGEKLFKFIEPFFGQIEPLAEEIRGGSSAQIRIGASEAVLASHIPVITRAVQKRFPHLKLSLKTGYQAELIDWLVADELDLIISLTGPALPPGIQCRNLLELSMVLLAPKTMKLNSSSELFKRDRITENLICLPPAEPVAREFQAGLRRLKVDWFPSLEVSTLALVATYVAEGHGIGLYIEMPKPDYPKGLRIIPLDGFPSLTIGALWKNRPTPLMNAYLDVIEAHVASLKQP